MTDRRPFDLVYTDLVVDLAQSFQGSRYCIIFVDAATRFTWVSGMKTKEAEESKEKLQEFKDFVSSITINGQKDQYRVGTIRADGDGAYTGGFDVGTFRRRATGVFSNFATSNGIWQEFAAADTDGQHNGLAESTHGVLAHMANSMIHHAQLSIAFWEYGMNYASWIYNRLPHTMTGVSPD